MLRRHEMHPKTSGWSHSFHNLGAHSVPLYIHYMTSKTEMDTRNQLSKYPRSSLKCNVGRKPAVVVALGTCKRPWQCSIIIQSFT